MAHKLQRVAMASHELRQVAMATHKLRNVAMDSPMWAHPMWAHPMAAHPMAAHPMAAHPMVPPPTAGPQTAALQRAAHPMVLLQAEALGAVKMARRRCSTGAVTMVETKEARMVVPMAEEGEATRASRRCRSETRRCGIRRY